jgi:phosphoribosylformylglycinamidine synthase
MGNITVADVPAKVLVLGGDAPVYAREAKEPGYLAKTRTFDVDSVPIPKDFNDILLRLLGSPTIASKRWVYEQYDSMVRTNTVMDARGDAGIVRIKGTEKALAMKTDCNSRYVYLNPRRGAQIAVAEAARNVVCVGARPIAITNCLNFGNPYDPEIFWQFREAIKGISDACDVFGTPVTGGNVSFYNEDPTGAVYPTPVIGMLGLIEDQGKIIGSRFSSPGDVVIVFGKSHAEIGGSEYLFLQTGQIVGEPPAIDLESEKRLQTCVLELINQRLLVSAHDISEGGLAVALSESAFGENVNLGVTVGVGALTGARPDFDLFGEDQTRIIASARPSHVADILSMARSSDVPAVTIGSVTDLGRIEIAGLIDIGREEGEKKYEDSITSCVA